MNYNILFLWTAFLGFTRLLSPANNIITENKYNQRKTTMIFAIIAFVPIVYFVVTSTWQYWGDYSLYIDNYKNFPVSINEAFNHIISQEDSYLFYVFNYVIKVIFNGNVFAYRLSVALLQSIPLILFFKKYSNNYTFTIFLFIANAIPIAWMLNGIRQLCAASILYGATHLFINKKYIRSIIVILIATLFHQSAIIMLPIVFVSMGKPWNKRTMLFILASLFALILFSHNNNVYESAMEDVGYDMSYYTEDDGVNPLRVLVSLVPVLLAYFGKKKINEDNSPIINFCTNMSIINFGLYLVGMVTTGILIGRLPLYTMMYSFILIPYLLNRLFEKQGKIIFYAIATVCYILYYYVQYVLV